MCRLIKLLVVVIGIIFISTFNIAFGEEKEAIQEEIKDVKEIKEIEEIEKELEEKEKIELKEKEEEKLKKEEVEVKEEEKEKEVEKKEEVKPRREVEVKKEEVIKKKEEIKEVEKKEEKKKEKEVKKKPLKKPKEKEVKKIVKKVLRPSIPAKITFLAGSVRVKRSGEEKWKKATLNMLLKPLDEIRTGYDSLAVITLNKEDTVTIKSNTHIVLSVLEKEKEDDSWKALIKLWLGEVRSHIKVLKERRGKFQIETLSAVAGIRGTDFIVIEGLDEITRVACFEGEVEVYDLMYKERVILKKNQITMVSFNQRPSPPRALTKDELKKFGIIEEEVVEKEKEEVEEKKKEEIKKKELPAWRKNIKMAGELGTEVINEKVEGKSVSKMYQRISFQPEFKIGKIGIGLDLFLLIDENNKIRKEDWDELSDIIEKIIYIRYGEKRDPFYIKLGGLDGVTLGHGMIMNNYSNLINYPTVRKKGVELGVRRKLYGLEAMVDDLRRANIYGTRVYLMPLGGNNLPFLNKFTIGATYCFDKNPRGDGKDISIMGLDAELPLKEGEMLDIILYADWASIRDHGEGISAPGLLIRVPLIMLKAEYRMMDNNFIPGYFNYLYELERDRKVISTSKQPKKRGFYAELASNIYNIVSLGVYYENYKETNPNLRAKIKLLKKIIPQITLVEASYSQNNIKVFKIKSEDTYIEWKIGYNLSGPVSLIYTYALTYEKEDGELKPVRSMSINTRIDF